MENTIIAPTYEVNVNFSWKYPGKPIINVEKQGYVQTTQTEDKLIAEEFINTFLGNYEIGICEVTNMSILSIKKISTFDEWVERYKPIKNEFEEYGSFSGCTFDYTEDDQWEFVKKQNPENVWTMVWAEDTHVIIPGFHWVNRDSYFVTELPVQKEDLSTEFIVI
jgi:hypothetical protein